jgi:hypothetical protein
MRFTRAVSEKIYFSIICCLYFADKLLSLIWSFILFHLMQVIFETSRLATIVNGVLRKTTKEMELNSECYLFYFYFFI